MARVASHCLAGVAAALLAVAVRDWTRPPAWQVQQCQPPLQSPVLHAQLLRAGSDKETYNNDYIIFNQTELRSEHHI